MKLIWLRNRFGTRDKCFIGVCLLLILFNFLVPFNFHLDLNYSPRFFSGDEKIVEILPMGIDGRVQLQIDSLNELKPEFINCLLAAENKEFFKGPLYFEDGRFSFKSIRPGMLRGIPLTGLFRAVISLGIKGGGSGLVQQLAKNLIHEGWLRNAQQKYSEGMLTFALTSSYSKEDLLLMYLNNVPVMLKSDKKAYGNNTKTYGFKSAIIRYFGTSNFKDLTLDQFGTLIASLKGGRFGDIDSIEVIKARRDNIFDRMVKNNMLSADEADKLKGKAISFSFGFKRNDCFRSAIQYVQKEAIEIAKENNLDTTLNGYRIYTTLSRVVQQSAADAVVTDFENLNSKGLVHFKDDTLETGMVIINPVNGNLLGMIGDASPYTFVGKLNHAFRDKNSIGSTIKPFVYGAFFEKGGDVNSKLLDGDIAGKGFFRPSNYEPGCSNKPQEACYCLSHSLNKATANLVNTDSIDVDDIKDFAKSCGYKGQLHNEKSMVLGIDYMSPLELANAYCPFANGGNNTPVVCIEKICDKNGQTVWDLNSVRRSSKWRIEKNAIRTSTAQKVTFCLEQTLEEGGTGYAVRSYYKGKAAGKTGTANAHYDTWFVGYTPVLCASVWVGGRHNKPLPAAINTGGRLAAPLWGLFMENLEKTCKAKKITYYFDKKWSFEN